MIKFTDELQRKLKGFSKKLSKYKNSRLKKMGKNLNKIKDRIEEKFTLKEKSKKKK